MADTLPLIPEITDEDIKWVCDLMQLDALDPPRRTFLTAYNTIDVSACPGSGKTTLVVAKLAILAKKWLHRTRGICVLSHMNVAREEIQCRLGGTVVGQRLLGYPHFIDTIHSFVNRFLALPWLYSEGHSSLMIDDNLTAAYRRRVLGERKYRIVRKALDPRHSGFDRLRIYDRDLNFDLGGRPFPFSQKTKSFIFAQQAVQASARNGYFCYDEMFVWARALLEDYPDIVSWLRCRFPLVIIDEMQDTFDLQSDILSAIFPRTSPEVVVQRIGDPNQAIFDDHDRTGSTNDPFPDADPTHSLSIPNSYRFGPEVAALASPFAVVPVGETGLCGVGPKHVTDAPPKCDNAIFVFPDDTTAGVLDAYGMHVLTTFDDNTLQQGVVTAVGGVHHDARDIVPGDKHYPKTVSHYWIGYRAEFARRELHPKFLVQYVRAAQAVVREGHDLSQGVERLASGVVRLASYIGDSHHLARMPRTHHAVIERLAAHDAALKLYQQLVVMLLIDSASLTQENWNRMKTSFETVAGALCDENTGSADISDFLKWPEDDRSSANETSTMPIDVDPNVYRVSVAGRHVDIRLGSIHSVKGQTHLATLLLSTFWNGHSSHRILPWLLGKKTNASEIGVQDRSRLLQTYVAMTRPSHMICLAIRRSAFGNTEAFTQGIATLNARGWRVAEIIDASPVWSC